MLLSVVLLLRNNTLYTYIIVFKNDCHNLRQHAVRTFTPLCFCSVALAIDWDDEEWISASRVIFLFSYGEIDNSVHLLESLIRGAETTTTTSTIRSTCTPTPSTPLSSPIETLSVCFVGIQWKQQLNPLLYLKYCVLCCILTEKKWRKFLVHKS